MDVKFQALVATADAPAPGAEADGEGVAAGVGALALDKRRRPLRQSQFVHFRKARAHGRRGCAEADSRMVFAATHACACSVDGVGAWRGL